MTTSPHQIPVAASTVIEVETPLHDPFLLDLEGVRALASDGVVRRGLQYFKENCVTDIGWTDTNLWATVAGGNNNNYQVEGIPDGTGEAVFDCTCPFDQEPVCKHVVATLLAYSARQAVSEKQIQTATDAAVEERIQSARTEVMVEHFSGEPWFGTWQARSVNSSAAALRPYRVVIRSLQDRLNTCNCPDFAQNRLGTCKHIEAVLGRIKKRGVRGGKKTPPVAVVHLAWDVPDAPRVRLGGAISAISAASRAVLARHFDANGLLRGSLPDAWFALHIDVESLTDVTLGEDAADHAHRAAEDAIHRDRAGRIVAEMTNHGRQMPGMKLPLLPYQVKGAAFLAATGKALLADDMGLGKTVQAIAAAHWLIENQGVRRVLIVAPTSNKKHWADEVTKFTHHAAKVVDGNAKARELLYASDIPFLVVHYETVRSDQSLLCDKYPADVLILDEAQRIKNWRTRTAAVIKSLPGRYVFALSGTPLENKLEELYSLMQRIDQRVLGPLWRFKLDFTVTDERGKELTYRNLGELRRRLKTVMLRRDRAIIADQLPARTDQVLRVPMTARQTELHDAAVNAAGTLAAIMKRRPLSSYEEKKMMAALQSARMACDAAGLVDKLTLGSPKLDEFARLIETLCLGEHRKVVVFSQWELMTRMAAAVLDQLGVGYCNLHGGVAVKARGALLERFDKDPTAMVFLSTDAGATGLNLQVASAMIVLDLPWNPAILDQRIARIHRLRQTSNVLVITLIAENSYEEHVAALIASKRELFGAAMADEGGAEVVGVSKKMLAVALEVLESLQGAKAAESPAPSEPSLPDEQSAEAELDGHAPTDVSPPDESEPTGEAGPEAPEATPTGGQRSNVEPAPNVDPMFAAIEQLSTKLAGNLERVVVARGGLVAVVDALTDTAQATGAEVADACGVELAVLDGKTWATLQRLGSVPSGAETKWQRPEVPEPPPPSPFVALSKRKLAAARIMLANACTAEAVPLLFEAVKLALAARASRADLPELAQVVGWVFGELLPKGLASQDDATLVLKLQGLAGVAEVPDALVAELATQVAVVVG